MSPLGYRWSTLATDGNTDISHGVGVGRSFTLGLPFPNPMYPHPISGRFVVSYTIPTELQVHLTLYAMHGREVLRLIGGGLSDKENILAAVPAVILPSEQLFIVLSVGGKRLR